MSRKDVTLLYILVVSMAGLTVCPAANYSGTLPVLFINTDDSIDSNTEYVTGTYYLDDMGCEDMEPLGTPSAPLSLKIRGRGNWTWTGSFPKKPYRIKLDRSQQLAGMTKHRDFALLAHYDGGQCAFFRNTAAFELSRLLELDYTPAQQPIELVLNGSYEGLYFLTETISVDDKRLSLTEQEDLSTDEDSITGGWLVEIDNTKVDNQLKISVKGTELVYFWITYHYPKELSEQQADWLGTQMKGILTTIYQKQKNKTPWEEYIDIETLVRFYMIHEILDNPEAFLGSCFMHKDRGEQTWKFGPVWDCGSALNDWHDLNTFSYDYQNKWQSNIMRELAKYPQLQDRIKKLWNEQYPMLYAQLESRLRTFANQIAAACVCDHERWPQSATGSAAESLDYCLAKLEEKKSFLIKMWTNNGMGVKPEETESGVRRSTPLFDMQGRPLRTPLRRKGIFIKNNRLRYGE